MRIKIKQFSCFCFLVSLMCVAFTTHAQEARTVKGVVKDIEDSSVIPGVAVTVKGASGGTMTDIDGKFSIKVPQGSSTLVLQRWG